MVAFFVCPGNQARVSQKPLSSLTIMANAANLFFDFAAKQGKKLKESTQ